MKKMKIEDQVASVGPSKKLRELGVKQDSIWYWNDYITSKPSLSEGKRFEDKLATDGTYIQYSVSAFTVAELGDMLPIWVTSERDNEGGFFVRSEDAVHNTSEKTEADARAKMLIYLIKEGSIKVEDIK